MSQFFNIILVSLSHLLFSSPAFVKMAENSLAGVRQVENSSRGMCTSPSGPALLDEVLISDYGHERPPLLEAATTRPSTERLPSLDDFGQTVNASESPPSNLKSATSISSSPIISDPHYPRDSDAEILALNSFKFSLVDDSSVDESEFNVSGSLDTLSSSPPPYSITLQSSKLLSGVSGLGISGLMRKDGSAPFDGLGIVSIDSHNWLPQRDGIERSDPFGRRPSPSTYDSSSESGDFDPSLAVTGDKLSDIFLQETFLTFTKDPFHELCISSVDSSSSNPDCGNSWSELSLDDSPSISTSDSLPVADTKSPSTNGSLPTVLNYHRRTPKLNTNFSSTTISSELKRSSIQKSTLRNRASSLPSSTTGTTGAIPLPRCKWRL